MKPFSKGLFLVSLAGGLLMSSCGNEAPWNGTNGEGGKISLNLTTDGSVYRSTRADDNMSPVVPGADEFRISLNSSDGSYSKEWSTLTAFNKEEGFPMGNYKIVAEYGDLDTEGFTAPYYKGDEDVNVMLGEESSVSVTASLANSMVSIRYTDEFTQTFPAYSASIQSKGHEPIVFAQNETRPAYVAPSDIALAITMSKDMDKTVTVNPASFTATARRHYIVTIGVEGNVAQGTGVLKVTFEENVVSETIDITLSDELFNAPEPYVTPNDDAKGEIEHFESITFDGNPEFHVFAYGGMKSAKLTVTAADGGKVPAFGSEVELVNADATAQAQLKAAGVDCAGFFKQAGELGVINFKEFIKNLAPGSYKVSLNVTDNLGRSIAAEDLSVLNAKISAVEYEVLAGASPKFMGETMEVVVATNCDALKDEMSFKVDGKEVKVSGTPSRVQAPVQTRADFPYQYKYTLAVDPIADSEVSVSGVFGSKPVQTVKVAVDMPQYTMDTDAFAKRVKIRVNYDDADMRKIIVEKAKVYFGNSTVSAGNITRDIENGIIEVKGLNSATAYNTYSLTLGTNKERNNTVVPAFTTETEADVPNGNFNNLGKRYLFEKIQVGGQWNVPGSSWYKYTNYSTVDRYEPEGWTSLNDFTCWSGSSNKNTWFLVPSTYVENQEVVVRTVGYHHNGTTPDQSAEKLIYFCMNAPKELQVSKGELFLGSYSYDGNENRANGIAFNTRPSYLQFDYKYNAINGETGEVEIIVFGADDEVLSKNTAQINQRAEMGSFKVVLPDYEFGKKAEKIYVGFKSTVSDSPQIIIPSGEDELKDNTNYKLGTKEYTISANQYKAFAKGSELTIDNVTLGYDDNAIARAPKNSKK